MITASTKLWKLGVWFYKIFKDVRENKEFEKL